MRHYSTRPSSTPFRKPNKFKTSLVAGVSLLAVCAGGGAQAQVHTLNYSQPQGEVNVFQIEAGDLKTALNAYIEQSGKQLIYRDDQIRGVKTMGAAGSLTNKEALVQLLAGSQLIMRRDSSGAVLVVLDDSHTKAGWQKIAYTSDAEKAASLDVYEEDEQQESTGKVTIDEIVAVGSRRAQARSALEAIVPVDVIRGDDLSAQGNTNIIDVLTSVIPSLSANREPISDAATMVRPVNLRALPSDHTLVLVNGKRRHRGAVLGEFVSGVNRGAQGADITPLFGAALKQVEVLRDGASAQYGSDAIAGVINYALQDDPEIRMISAQYGSSYQGDGDTWEASGALGTHVGDEGFAVLSFNVKDASPTSRGVQDGEGTNSGAAALAAAGFPVADPVVVWGSPEVKNDYKIIVNAGLPVGEAELYTFGNYATRDVDGSFFYRNPTNRSGVFAAGGNVLFGDTTGDGGCPTGPLPTSSFGDAEAFINSAPANCFAFQSLYPGGFTPRFGGTVEDYSATAGVKGEFGFGLIYDASISTGRNDVDYRISNSLNASLGPDTPTDFNLGRQVQSETVANADFNYPVKMEGWASDLNVAFGMQYHKETFEIVAGDLASYEVGPYIDQGFSAGANGFQGFNADVAGKFSRNSISGYIDLEADITDQFMMSFAGRFEDFSDFGSTVNAKVASRYNISENFAVRGAFSTGFRAPTLGQSNLQRSSTAFSGGQLIEQLVIASTNPIAEFFGGGQLDPEKARNWSMGIVASVGELDITLDYFRITVKDRISLTSADIDDASRTALVAAGNPEAATISNVQFFVNDFDTRTQGLDLVANYKKDWDDYGQTNVTLALNYTDTKVTNRGATIGDGREREIEDALPSTRATMTFSHDVDKFNGILRFNYFGEAYESLFNDSTLPVATDALVIVDAQLSYQITESLDVAVGAKNIFNAYPKEWETAGFSGRDGGFLGAIYPLNHPAGFNGGSYYVRVTANF
ncbi:TonB-dependent receptor [Paremcibacter congregatus]|uniref:TonB-dependent receptor n=1 Tax=Paremcibacter congregatus TaxID=2043170 RepID=UPI0030EB9FA1|tara:strand:+ start:6337 stop:9276 length:2940 start_codon:yes stop_codon:yes gene_type:complete